MAPGTREGERHGIGKETARSVRPAAVLQLSAQLSESGYVSDCSVCAHTAAFEVTYINLVYLFLKVRGEGGGRADRVTSNDVETFRIKALACVRPAAPRSSHAKRRSAICVYAPLEL